MRLFGPQPGPLRRLLPWLVALFVLLVVGGLTLWGRQQETARRQAEARAEVAELQLARVEAALTSIAFSSAAATATALAEANLPEMSLRRALDLAFEAYKDPSEGRLRALQGAFGPEALSFLRVEAEHLISAGTHLAGASAYEIEILSTNATELEQVQIRTRELWTYDEVDSQNRRSRCVREESEQTYTLRRLAAGWLVDDVELSGPTRRSDC
jgi:hypothetical protein